MANKFQLADELIAHCEASAGVCPGGLGNDDFRELRGSQRGSAYLYPSTSAVNGKARNFAARVTAEICAREEPPRRTRADTIARARAPPLERTRA